MKVNTKDIEIKVCPFCGKLPHIWRELNSRYFIDCNYGDCLFQPGLLTSTETRELAIEKWNKRTSI